MTISATLVGVGNNHIRYLLSYSGEGPGIVSITTTGAASPDLQTDSLYGPIRTCAFAFNNGLGILPAGALTQAQARAIWNADNSDTVLGNSKVPRCRPRITRRDGGAGFWTVDANVDGSGHPVINAGASGIGATDAYLDIEVQGPIGL